MAGGYVYGDGLGAENVPAGIHQIQNAKLGANREKQITELEQARLRRLPLVPSLRAEAER